ncbi:MAG: hypothetical protein WCD70_16300 [Alphaproteobacteria bacterium]
MSKRTIIGFIFLILSALASLIDSPDYYISLLIATFFGGLASFMFVKEFLRIWKDSQIKRFLKIVFGALSILALYSTFIFFVGTIDSYTTPKQLQNQTLVPKK